MLRTSGRAATLALPLLLIALPELVWARFQWDRTLLGCEPPATFYSSRHVPGVPPCCPSVEGLCAGGELCPTAGQCSGSEATCDPAPAASRPNVVLMISDDHGSCHYGSAGECRSPQKGVPIPAPVTPNLDILAGYGTVFPVAHNTSSWCFPSLFSIVTGRYQRSFGGVAKPADEFGTIAHALRRLSDDPSIVPDPYDDRNGVGGYCTFLGGKLTNRLGDPGFHAYGRTGERSIGRTQCDAPANGGGPPRCGTEAQASYDPTKVFGGSDLFEFLETLYYRVPADGPATFAMKNFFAWYAPRIPHQPLRAPAVIRHYLFGNGPAYPLGGQFDLGRFCSGASCPLGVRALDETVFGDVREFYGNVWWMDDGIREIRKYLAIKSRPHCIAADGRTRFDVASPETCNGTWAAITPDLARNTIFLFLADNGWHLPDSKHAFTENGTRTRMIVFDPRALPHVPSWDPTEEAPPPPQESAALAHAVDVVPTALGFALGTVGTQACPEAPAGGSRCDGRDLRPHLYSAPSGPAAPATLRRAMCGHQTQKVTTPTRNRYLITRPGSVGRCTVLDAPPCTADEHCGPEGFCLAERCMPRAEPTCTATADCPAGAACLGGRCRSAPACLDDGDCVALLPGLEAACVAREQKWCRNAPGTACAANADCPACPPDMPACGRVCEPRQLKFYVMPGGRRPQVTDLFLDPDEVGLHKSDPTSLTGALSRLDGPYGPAMRRANCCIDAWWPEAAALGTSCGPEDACPDDLTCNR